MPDKPTETTGPLSASDGSIKIGDIQISTLRGHDRIAIERSGGEGGWFSLREFHDMVQEFVSERL